MSFRLSPFLAVIACALGPFAAHAADVGKDCPDKPAPVLRKRPVHRVPTVPVRLVQPVQVVAPVPAIAVVVPPAPVAPPSGNCVNLAAGRADGAAMAWTDWQCVTQQKARLLQSLGKGDAAVALLCGEPQMREALIASGTACPGARQEEPGALPSRSTATASAR
jgi:hypothetical protein